MKFSMLAALNLIDASAAKLKSQVGLRDFAV